MLTWKNERNGSVATYAMPGGTWTFRMVEHDDCNELVILDTSHHRREMCMSKFGTPSQARRAAEEFVKEFLAPV